jgi:hypothetical protein
MQIANELAPPLKAALEAGSRSEARIDLDAVALVADFFSVGEESLCSSFGQGRLELPIFDCRLTAGQFATPLFQSTRHGGAISNRQWLQVLVAATGSRCSTGVLFRLIP